MTNEDFQYFPTSYRLPVMNACEMTFDFLSFMVKSEYKNDHCIFLKSFLHCLAYYTFGNVLRL